MGMINRPKTVSFMCELRHLNGLYMFADEANRYMDAQDYRIVVLKAKNKRQEKEIDTLRA